MFGSVLAQIILNRYFRANRRNSPKPNMKNREIVFGILTLIAVILATFEIYRSV